MNHDVFISYSSKNPTAAQAICHELEDNGIKCWMAPRDITPGKKYGDLIDDAILTCRVFLLVYSADSLSSQWCNGELNVAFTEGKTIIPYRIDATPLKGAMRVILNQTHWIDAYPNYKTRFKDLVTVVGQSLGKTIPSHTPAPIPQPTPNRFKKFWWIALCAVVIGVFGWVWSNRESADYPNIEENIPSEIITEEIKSDDSDANAELEELRATQERLEKENNELKHNNEELENNNKYLQKDIGNIKAKEEAERQAKLQAEKKAKEEAEKSAKLQAEKKTKQNTAQTQIAQKVEIKETKKDNDYLLSLPDSEFVTYKDANGKYGYKLKSTGEIVIPTKYNYAYHHFSEGLAVVKLDSMGWGFIDKTGKEVIPLKYDDVRGFSEGLAAVKLDSMGWGFIDKTGKEVIPLKYNAVGSYCEGLAAVKFRRRWGYIDKTGKEIISPKYNDTFGFSEGRAAVVLNSRGGFIDKTGKEVIPILYKIVTSFRGGKAYVISNKDEEFYIDKNGNRIE